MDNTQLILTELEYLEKKKRVLEKMLHSTSVTKDPSAITTHQLLSGGNAMMNTSLAPTDASTHHHTVLMKRVIC